MSSKTITKKEVVITGAGLVSKAGDSIEKHMQALEAKPAPEAGYKLESFKSAAYLSDRRMLKAVSKDDGFALAAIEILKKDSGLATEGDPVINPWKMGLYVGAPPSTAFDNENYFGKN